MEEGEGEYSHVVDVLQIPSWSDTLQLIQLYKKFPHLQLISRLPGYHDLLQGVSLESRFEHDPRLNQIVSLWRGDLLRLNTDAIVNSSHHQLAGGGGIDGKIHWAIGEPLLHELQNFKTLASGHSIITSGFNLPCKYIIHTVAPHGENPTLLEACYRSALDLAKERGLRTIGFCCLGTGHYEYPPVSAAQVALRTVHNWLTQDDNWTYIDRIIFSVFMARDECIYEGLV